MRIFVLWVLLFVPSMVSAATVLPIVAETEGATVRYKISGQPTKLASMMQAFRTTYAPTQADIDNTSVVVIANDKTSVATLQNLRSILQKYGFRKLHYFVHHGREGYMAELSFNALDRPISYTDDPKKLVEIVERSK